MDQVGLGLLALQQAKDILSVHKDRQQAEENAARHNDPIAKMQHRKVK